MKKIYHISNPKNNKSILKNGLQANEEGEIFLFDNIEQGVMIASNQIGISDISYFEIHVKGIIGKLKKDNVGDFGSMHQYILYQDLIKPKFIKHLKDEKYHPLDLIELTERTKYKGMGFGDEQIFDMLRLFPEKVKRYNEKHGTSVSVITADELNGKKY